MTPDRDLVERTRHAATDVAPAGDTLSVMTEDLRVSKLLRETGGVRVRIEASERLAEATGEVTTSTVEVERIARNQVVSETCEPWNDGDVLVVPVYRDEWVQVRQLVLVEEVRLRTHRDTRTERVDVPLREERAIVERQGLDGIWRAVTSDAPVSGSALQEEQAG